MRVLLDAVNAPGQPRGVGHYVRELAMHLTATDDIAVSLAFGSWHRDFYAPAAMRGVGLIEVRGLPTSRITRHAWHALRVPSLARAVAADVVHLTELVPAPRDLRVPLVVTAHDLGEYDLPDTYGALQVRYRRLILRPQLRRADRIVTPSRASAERLFVHEPRLRERTKVVAHGPGIAAGTPLAEPTMHIGRSFFLHVGALQRHKNVPRLVRAFRGLSDPFIDLVLAGPDDNDAAAVQEAIGTERRVHRLPAATDGELAWLYTRAVGLVFPTLNEGFGLPILEGMGFGCPVITSDRGAPQELAGEAAILIDPFDEMAIQTAMPQRLEDSGLRGRLVARGLERAAAYSWQRAATEMAEVYREALETRG